MKVILRSRNLAAQSPKKRLSIIVELLFKASRHLPIGLAMGLLIFFGLETINSKAWALMPQDPIATSKHGAVVSPTLTLSKIDYEPERGNDFDIERNILGVGVAIPVGSDASADIGFGLILDTEVDNIDESGDGYQILFGFKSLVHRSGSAGVFVNGSFGLSSEKIKDNNITHEIELNELHLGTTLAMMSSPKIQPYVGLDLALMSDGEFKTKTSVSSSKSDFERDDIFDIRLGIKVPLGKVGIKAEALLLGQTTINLGVDLAL